MNSDNLPNMFAFFVLLVLLSSSASFVLAQEPPAAGVVGELQEAGAIGTAPSTTAATTAAFASCVGGDLGRLTGDIAKCNRFKDTFEKYWRESGLAAKGVDLAFIYTMAVGESGCNSKYAGDARGGGGGIMQATNDCPEKCNSLDDEIKYGMAELAGNVKKLEKFGIPSGRDGSWLLMYSYNRGVGGAKAAINQLKAGKPIQAAIQDSCFEVYLRNPKHFCYDGTERGGERTPNIAARFHCAGTSWDSICDEGKTCQQWSGCFLNSNDMPIGIHYVGARWPRYTSACEKSGGTLVEAGAPIEAPPPTAALGEEAAEEEPIPAGYRPTHPYFSVPYSINPSFSVTVPYDFAVYDKISDDLRGLERCRDDVDCILGKVAELESASPGLDWLVQYGGNVISQDSNGVLENFAWETYCEKPSVHAVNSLAEAIDNCANSADKECVCTYNLPVAAPSSVLGPAWESFIGGEFDIASLLGAARFFAAEYEELSKWRGRKLSFERTRQGLKVGLKAITLGQDVWTAPTYAVEEQLVRDAWLNKVDPDLQGDTPKSLIYTSDQAGESIDIFKERGGNISIYKQGSAPEQRQCEVHNKMLKFCIVQNQSVLSYDYDKNRMGLQQLVLRFAYLFRSKITDVKNFRVLDARLASSTVLLVWDPVLGVDTAFYTIYYSPDPSVKATLGSQAPKDVDVSALGIAALELPADEYSVTPVNMRIDSLLSPKWDFDSVPFARTYLLETAIGSEEPAPSMQQLDADTLYFSTLDKKYFYFLPGIEDDQPYFFAVTATDGLGEESPSFNAPVEQELSKDDVPPSLATVEDARVEGGNLILEVSPVTNMDGSYLDPALSKGFTLYCFVDESNLDLSSRRHFFAENQEVLDNGRTRLYISLRDINGPNCGAEQSPSSVMIVAAGRKQGPVEDYADVISPAMLSSPVAVR